MKDAHSLVEFFSAMSAVDRFSQFRLVNPESILEHTGMVAIMTMFICDQIDLDPLVELDAIRHALCHDMDEILTGDIPMPTKYSSPKMKDMIDEVAEDNIFSIARAYEIDVYPYWTGDKYICPIVKMADVIAVFYKAYQEVEMFGNKTMLNSIAKLGDGLLNSALALRLAYPDMRTEFFDMVDEMIAWVQRAKI